jgi:hypothetical protein
MSIIDMKAFSQVAKKDFEFTREVRYLNGVIKVGIGDDQYDLKFIDGKLQSIDDSRMPDSECKIVIRGTKEHWENMLQKYPKPFYQCLQSTAVKHGLHLSDTNETFAYLPAMNRMVQLMRQERNRR